MHTTPVTPSSPDLLTYSEAAEYIHLSVRQLERAVAGELLAFYRINGRNIRFTIAQLDAYLAAALVLPRGAS
jgi:excisionase family DNA binding protein